MDFLGRKGLWYFRARDLSRGQVLEGAGYLGLSDSWLLVNELGGLVKEGHDSNLEGGVLTNFTKIKTLVIPSERCGPRSGKERDKEGVVNLCFNLER